jgi:hypothetical protein
MANRRVEYPGGSYQTGYQESIIRNLERLLPNWTFVKQMASPEEGGRYPEDESRLGRFFRELGVVPIKISGDEEIDTEDWAKEAEEISGQKPGPEVLKLRRVYMAYEAEVSEYEKKHDKTSLTDQERLAVINQTVARLDPSKQKEADRRSEEALLLSDEDAEDALAEAREKMGLTKYGQIERKLSEAKAEGMQNVGQHDG